MQSSLSGPSKGRGTESRIAQPGVDAYNSIFRFFGLRENPFRISPDPRFLAFTRQTQEAFDALTHGIQTNQGLMLLTGEVGTGKTTITNFLLNWLRQRQTPTSYIFNARLSPGDLFDFALSDFGIPCESNQKIDKLGVLTKWLQARSGAGKTPILIVDEAQGLPFRVLEEIRLLLNLETPREKLLQILLVGQPELEEKFRRPEARQLRQRVSVHCKISPLSLPETRSYIQRRMHLAGADGEPIFQSEAMDAVHHYSSGIPRVINILSEHALINAYADKIRPVPPHIVQEVAREYLFGKIEPCDVRSNFNSTGSASANTTRSISPILPVHSVEVPEPAPTEPCNILLNHAPVPAVDKNPAACAPIAMSQVATERTKPDDQVAPWHRWKPSFLPSLPLRPQWRDRSSAVLNFPILQHSASSVIRWLREPVRPVHMRRRVGQGMGAYPIRRRIMLAQVREEIWTGIVRLWNDTEGSLEF